MQEKLKRQLIKKFFENDEFRLFADAIPHALLIVNQNGEIVFANDAFQKIAFQNRQELTPFTPYKEAIDPTQVEIIESIASSFTTPHPTSRQITVGKKIFLFEGFPIMDGKTFKGLSFSITDITAMALQERQQRLIYQISQALSSVQDYHRILQIAVNQIKNAMDVNSVNIMILNKKTNKLCIEVDTHVHKPNHIPRCLSIGEGIAGKVAETLTPFSTFDIANSPEYTQKRKSDKGGLLVVPLALKGKVFGVVNVADSNPRYFTEQEVQFLTIVANDIAVALENSLLYQRLNHKVEVLSKLFRLSSFVGAHRLDYRIEQIVKTIPDLLDSESCGIYLSNSKHTTMKIAYQNAPTFPLPKQLVTKTDPAARLCLLQQKTLLLSSATIDAYFARKSSALLRNVLLTPIWVNDRPVGVLTVVNKQQGDFDDEDKNIAQITAYRIGTKIENARLVRRVQREKETVDSIIENTSEGVAVLDKNRRIIIWNRYLEELTGLNSNDLIGLPYQRIFQQKLKLKQLTHNLQNISNAQRPYYIEEQMLTANQGMVWVGIVHSTTRDLNDDRENTILVFRNVTKDKELIEAKNEFISLTTHELRTPLTAIRGYISMIMQGDAGNVTPKQKQYFGKALDATNRLVSLVEELLNVIRIEEDRVKFAIQPFNIRTVIERSIEDLRVSAHAKKLQLVFESKIDPIACADPDKTRQIIMNLLENAIKYTKDKGTITVTQRRTRKEVIVSVQDTGVGIADKDLNSVFEKFVRINNPLSVKAGGTGLGLYIVKNLVERQGGKIWVESVLRKGTTFSFSLPLAPPTSTLPPNEGTVPVVHESERSYV